jgi:hypothetical protein
MAGVTTAVRHHRAITPVVMSPVTTGATNVTAARRHVTMTGATTAIIAKIRVKNRVAIRVTTVARHRAIMVAVTTADRRRAIIAMRAVTSRVTTLARRGCHPTAATR